MSKGGTKRGSQVQLAGEGYRCSGCNTRFSSRADLASHRAGCPAYQTVSREPGKKAKVPA